MNTKHTPGPWKVGRYTPNATEISILTTGGAPVTPAWGPKFYVNSEQAKANARLIAAAPDLLEALKDLLGTTSDTREVNGRYECRWCGREWSALCGDNEVPENCPSDDCPGHIARAAIAKTTTSNL